MKLKKNLAFFDAHINMQWFGLGSGKPKARLKKEFLVGFVMTCVGKQSSTQRHAHVSNIGR